MVANFVQFAGGEAGVYENWPCTVAGQGQEESHKGAAVFTDDHASIAGTDIALL
jgi:hypothetical protein